MVFLDVIVFFPLIVFPSTGFTPSSSNSYCGFFGGCQLPTTSFTSVFLENLVPAKLRFSYAKQHVRYTQNEVHIIKSEQCLTRTIFDTRSYRFHYRFVIVLVHVPHAANYQNIGSPLDHIKWLQHMDHSPVSKSLEKEPESNRISSCCCFEPVPETLFDIYVWASLSFFSSYLFFEWELNIANGGSWNTKRIAAGLFQSPI